jgi:5-methylcytosine-specific restriction enzyme B
MPERSAELLERVVAWDRAAFEPIRQEADRQRLAIVARFPLEAWPTLELDRYALGTSVHRSFCWHLEFGATELGSIRGGSAFKHIIFKRGSGEWYFPEGFATVEDAWDAFRGQMVHAFRLVAAGDFDGISAHCRCCRTGR